MNTAACSRLFSLGCAYTPWRVAAEWEGAGGPKTSDEYKALLYNLPAIAGLSGATLRIPNSFMIMCVPPGSRNFIQPTNARVRRVSGGRNVVTGNSFCTTDDNASPPCLRALVSCRLTRQGV